MGKKVLLTEPYVEITDTEPLSKLKEVAEVCVASSSSEKELAKEIRNANGLIVRMAKINRTIIESSKVLQIISRTGVGVDNIDLDAATEKGVYVCNVPALNAESVAEHAFGLLLSLAKNLLEADKRLRAEGWRIRDKLWPRNIELSKKVLGIVGLGAIGSRVAIRAHAFEMKVLAYDPYISVEKAEKTGVKLVDLNTLLKESDFVTIHCLLSEETRNLINQKNIQLMKKAAFLINCARGPIVNENTLIDALKKRRIAGAALDVFDKEPINIDNTLLNMRNVIVTPHVAGMTYEARVRTIETLVDDILRTFKGQIPKNLVNKSVLNSD
ncbi:MAG: hydroxyacid dehydrogenase [Candidatus Bathyarchaeota archaeon]|nr:MAG: hydroxyacid dehydrogenase [Candidatus Bathyarchaeota archaeon]